MVQVGAYVLGEFGHLIANDPNSKYAVAPLLYLYSITGSPYSRLTPSPTKQLNVLQCHYPLLSPGSRAHMLSTYVKLSNLFPEIRPQVQQVFRSVFFGLYVVYVSLDSCLTL